MRKLLFIASLLLVLNLSQHGLKSSRSSKMPSAKIKTEVTNTESPNKIDIKKTDKPQKTDNPVTDENIFKSKPTLKYNLHGIPVLTYHSISYEKGNPIRMPKEQFEKEMKYLKENNYYTLSLDELYDYFVNKKPIPEKSIVLTFDDGYRDNYINAYPILKKYNFKAAIFVITDMVDKESFYLTSNQLKELQKNGIDIESHTATHENLSELSFDAQLKELNTSKNYLENLLSKKIKYLAYPCGEYSDDTLKAVKEAGYIMAFTTAGRWSDKSDGILTLDRVYISTFHNMNTFNERITNPEYSFKY